MFFHVCFVFESKLTTRSTAMKVSSFLPLERTMRSIAVFLTSKSTTTIWNILTINTPKSNHSFTKSHSIWIQSIWVNLPLKSFPLNCIVFSVIIKMHLYITGGYVDFVTSFSVNTMIMRLFLVMLTTRKLFWTVIHWCDPSEPIFECFIHFLMPFTMTDHLFFLCKHLRVGRKIL